LAKAGVDIDQLDRLLAGDDRDQRRRLAPQTAETVEHLPAAAEAFRRAIGNRRKSLERLAGLVPPPSGAFDSWWTLASSR
jgi:hypothetical protein